MSTAASSVITDYEEMRQLMTTLGITGEYSDQANEIFYSCHYESKGIKNQGSSEAISEKFKLFGTLLLEKVKYKGNYKAILLQTNDEFKENQELLLGNAATKAYRNTQMTFGTDMKTKHKSTIKCAVETCKSLLILDKEGLGYCCAAHQSIIPLIPQHIKDIYDAKHKITGTTKNETLTFGAPVEYQKKPRKTPQKQTTDQDGM